MTRSATVKPMKAWWPLGLALLLIFAAGCGVQMEEGRTLDKKTETEAPAEGGSGSGEVATGDFPLEVMTSDQDNWRDFKMETSGLEGSKSWVLNYDTTNQDAAAIEKFYTDQLTDPEVLDGGGFVIQVNGKSPQGHPVTLQITAPDTQTDPNALTHVTVTVKQK